MLHDFEVTVTSTTQITVLGVPVMVKSVSFDVLDFVSVKKLVVEPSGCAFTSIVTPDVGSVELTVTLNGKVGPGAGASVVPAAGVVDITTLGSLVQGSVVPPPPPLPQKGIAAIIIAEAKRTKILFFIRCFISELDKHKFEDVK